MNPIQMAKARYDAPCTGAGLSICQMVPLVQTSGGKAESSEPMLISGLNDLNNDQKPRWSGNFSIVPAVGRDEQTVVI